MRIASILTGFVIFLFAASASQGAPTEPAASPPQFENIVVLELKDGPVVVLLRPDLAPKHVERVKQLVGEGFYNGHKFHRVIDGFMAQTGDPTGTGTGGSPYPDLPAEFSKEEFGRGCVGAARSADPNSANSQFFICFEAAPWLNGQYTLWGEVIAGMEHVDKIKRGEPVADPDIIVRMTMAADADENAKGIAAKALRDKGLL
jgi:peptidylprolyl isomerase